VFGLRSYGQTLHFYDVKDMTVQQRIKNKIIELRRRTSLPYLIKKIDYFYLFSYIWNFLGELYFKIDELDLTDYTDDYDHKRAFRQFIINQGVWGSHFGDLLITAAKAWTFKDITNLERLRMFNKVMPNGV